MTVYDVIRITRPGAPCSYRPGRVLVGHHDLQSGAEAELADWIRTNSIPEWVSYEIRKVDEDSATRDWTEGMFRTSA